MHRVIALSLLAYSIQIAAAQRLRVDFDHQGNFSQYRTYSWSGPPELEGFNQLMQQRVAGFVEESLAAKGLKHIPSGGELLISCRMTMREEERFVTFTNGFGGGWDWGGGSAISTTTADPLLFGTLTVDMVDAHRNQLVFQGTTTSSVSSRATRNTRTLARSVRKIFEKYPPK